MIEYRTHEEMLDKHVGKKGSPERKAYDEEVKKVWRNTVLVKPLGKPASNRD